VKCFEDARVKAKGVLHGPKDGFSLAVANHSEVGRCGHCWHHASRQDGSYSESSLASAADKDVVGCRKVSARRQLQ
jgi:hypothetical protein